MTTIANASQSDAWNGDSGRRWVARADQRDKVLGPVADVLLAAAAPSPGSRVLDIGCGCGATTLLAANAIGAVGSAIGIDLSAPMLDVARQRATSAGVNKANFILGDAQTHAFERDSTDLVISRFGTMFFSDPVAAFSNIGTALRPGGRLCIATWQPLAANEWLTVPGAVLLRHTEMPETTPGEPGMFAQSDPETVTACLIAADFEDVNIEAREITFTLGQTVDEAVEYLADSGPGRLMLESIAEGPARDAALADVHDALVDHFDDSGVRLSGGIWLITATTDERGRDSLESPHREHAAPNMIEE
jgi:SAM-dependent methyltransferase